MTFKKVIFFAVCASFLLLGCPSPTKTPTKKQGSSNSSSSGSSGSSGTVAGGTGSSSGSAGATTGGSSSGSSGAATGGTGSSSGSAGSAVTVAPSADRDTITLVLPKTESLTVVYKLASGGKLDVTNATTPQVESDSSFTATDTTVVLSCAKGDLLQFSIEKSYFGGEINSISFAGCENLTELSILRQESVTDISAALAHFPKLQKLNLSRSGVTSLSLKDFAHLETVSLRGAYSDGKLATLTIENCPELTSLEAYGNLLTAITLKDVPKLNKVDIACNKFTKEGMLKLFQALPTAGGEAILLSDSTGTGVDARNEENISDFKSDNELKTAFQAAQGHGWTFKGVGHNPISVE